MGYLRIRFGILLAAVGAASLAQAQTIELQFKDYTLSPDSAADFLLEDAYSESGWSPKDAEALTERHLRIANGFEVPAEYVPQQQPPEKAIPADMDPVDVLAYEFHEGGHPLSEAVEYAEEGWQQAMDWHLEANTGDEDPQCQVWMFDVWCCSAPEGRFKKANVFITSDTFDDLILPCLPQTIQVCDPTNIGFTINPDCGPPILPFGCECAQFISTADGPGDDENGFDPETIDCDRAMMENIDPCIPDPACETELELCCSASEDGTCDCDKDGFGDCPEDCPGCQ